MRYLNLIPTFIMLTLFSIIPLARAQGGACTEDAIKKGNFTLADDAFTYMPPYGKPVFGKSATEKSSHEKFAGRTNIKRSWVGEHRIVSSPSGDMAYECGTMQMSYDENGKPNKFQAVMLIVYQTKASACQQVAETMEPLENSEK